MEIVRSKYGPEIFDFLKGFYFCISIFCFPEMFLFARKVLVCKEKIFIPNIFYFMKIINFSVNLSISQKDIPYDLKFLRKSTRHNLLKVSFIIKIIQFFTILKAVSSKILIFCVNENVRRRLIFRPNHVSTIQRKTRHARPDQSVARQN
jgi:hypothetical protein